MPSYFDAHCHLNDASFDADRSFVLNAMRAHGIQACCAGWDLPSSHAALQLANASAQLRAAVGIHPGYLDGWDESALRSLAEDPLACAIGECGLDPSVSVEMDRQIALFQAQLDLALCVGKPAVLHVRGAHAQAIQLLKARKSLPSCMLHGASASAEQIREYVKLGCMISFGGVITWSGARKAVRSVQVVPYPQLLIETDAPFQAPDPWRHERNTPEHLPSIGRTIARLLGISEDELAAITTRNANRFFDIRSN